MVACAQTAILLLCLLLTWNCVTASPIYLYEHKGHRGIKWSVDPYMNNCVNLATDNAASSADTHNECFIVYEKHNCEGRSMRISPGKGCHTNFKSCNFNDIVSSVRRC